MTRTNLPCVVSIAGTDPSGGAGIQADIKSISATGAYAASIITALVAQNSQGVQAILNVPTEFLQQQMCSVFSDLKVNAVKVGMLPTETMMRIVFNQLKRFKPNHLVVDPVMVAKDGSALLDLDTIHYLKSCLRHSVSLLTPNLYEAEKLLGNRIATFAEMAAAAVALSNDLGINVLIKGGHMRDDHAHDVLSLYPNAESHWFRADRVDTHNTHGTGCSLSAAIASYLAQGYRLLDAVAAAKQYLTLAIQSGAHFQIGHGNGPIDHFYFLSNRGSFSRQLKRSHTNTQ